jgi:putative nucleotidyltransferase with HDIG domain
MTQDGNDLPEVERHVLVCDDEPHIREPVAIFLRQNGFEVTTAADGRDGLEKFQKGDYFLVITDINMPGMTGIELLAEVKRVRPSADVVMITGNVDLDYAIQAIKKGAYDYFRKPFDFEDVLLTVSRVVEKRRLQREAAEAERLRGERSAAERNAIESVMALVQAVYSKDSYTRGHMERVGLYAHVIAETMGLEAPRRKVIERAGVLHDIGKIGTPDLILNKAGKLTQEEFLVIQLHPSVGAQIVRPITVLGEVGPLVRQHHEKWNGTGYPDRLSGEQIAVESRILAIADVFDALHSDRAYRPGLPLEKTVQIVKDGRGTHFDPEVVDCFISCLNDGSLLAAAKDSRGAGQVSAQDKVRTMAEEAQKILQGATSEAREEERKKERKTAEIVLPPDAAALAAAGKLADPPAAAPAPLPAPAAAAPPPPPGPPAGGDDDAMEKTMDLPPRS